MVHYLTKEGLEKLKNELAHMKTVTRKEVIERIAAAKELGDLRENAEYAEAKDDQALLEGKIAEYENIFKNVVIIDEGQRQDRSVVVIGSVVTVLQDGKSIQYHIVGTEEADPFACKISNESPLGRAFIGRRKGEKVTVRAPRGEFEFLIESIE